MFHFIQLVPDQDHLTLAKSHSTNSDYYEWRIQVQIDDFGSKWHRYVTNGDVSSAKVVVTRDDNQADSNIFFIQSRILQRSRTDCYSDFDCTLGRWPQRLRLRQEDFHRISEWPRRYTLQYIICWAQLQAVLPTIPLYSHVPKSRWNHPGVFAHQIRGLMLAPFACNRTPPVDLVYSHHSNVEKSQLKIDSEM
jgi:hypothetical protein